MGGGACAVVSPRTICLRFDTSCILTQQCSYVRPDRAYSYHGMYDGKFKAVRSRGPFRLRVYSFMFLFDVSRPDDLIYIVRVHYARGTRTSRGI